MRFGKRKIQLGSCEFTHAKLSTERAAARRMAETLLNGGKTEAYRWGQTLEEVTAHVTLESGLRGRDLSVVIRRKHLRVGFKASGREALIDGELAQPVRVDESTWSVEDGVLVIALVKDNQRAENTGPSSEWWFGLLAGENSLDSSKVSVEDYATMAQIPDEQRRQVEAERAEREAGEAQAAAERKAAAAAEAALPEGQRKALASLRESFPDIPIEYGDTSAGS